MKKTLFLVSLLCLVAVVDTKQVWAAPGDLDLSFGGDGKVQTDLGSSGDHLNSLALQDDGKIVAVGHVSGLHPVIFRYNSDGSLDQGFGENGKTVLWSTTGFFSDIAVLSSGDIVAIGGWSHFFLGFFDTNGNQTGPLIKTPIGAGGAQAQAVAIQPDGKILLGGNATMSFYSGSGADFTLVRYHPDGSLDEGFGNGGIVTTDFAKTQDNTFDLELQSDGKIVLAGYSGENDTILTAFALARYHPDGSLDVGFGDAGLVTSDLGAGMDIIRSIAIQDDGAILAGGVTSSDAAFGGTWEFRLSKFLADGQLDPTFGNGGTVTLNFGNKINYGTALKVQNDDSKILFGGYTGVVGDDLSNITSIFNFALARLYDDGSPDFSFGDAGFVLSSVISGTSNLPYAMAIQPDGQIILGGHAYLGASDLISPTDIALIRYDGDSPPPPPPPPSADLSIAITEDKDPVLIGQSLVYEVTVQNPGPTSAKDVISSITFPDGIKVNQAYSNNQTCEVGKNYMTGLTTVDCSLNQMAAATAFQISITATAELAGTFTIQAKVKSSTSDPNVGNNLAEITTTVVKGMADLAISVWDSADPVIVGQSFSYFVHVKNLGPSTAEFVRTTHTLSSGLSLIGVAGGGEEANCKVTGNVIDCRLGSIAPLANLFLNIDVKAVAVGTQSDTAEVKTSTMEPNLTNNKDVETTRVISGQ